MKKALVLFVCAIVLASSLAALLAAGVAGSGAPADMVRYVTADGDCAGFTPCYTGLQAAADAAAAGDELRVATGAYTGVSAVGDSSQALYLAKSLTVRGGYSDDFVSWDPAGFPSVVDAAAAGGGIRVAAGVSVTLEGLHVTGGRAARGAGILLEGVANATIKNCWVYSNTATGRGGGIAVVGATGPVMLINNYVHHNTAASAGGIDISGSQATLINPMLYENRLSGAGAGAGLGADGADVQILHATIVRNSGGDGVGVSAGGAVASRVRLTNTLMAGQTVGAQAASGSTLALDGTLWAGGAWTNGQRTAGPGTVTTAHDYTGDPRFTGVYHIAGNSAAVNRGVPAGIAYDIDGVPRPMGSAADLGAVESYTGMSIQYNQEQGGDIDLTPPDGVYENRNGAMVWNGAAWIINNAWGHGYFIDQYSRRRLYGHALPATFTGAGVSAGAPRVTVAQGYTVTEAIYTYSVPAQAGGTFRYDAVEYRITQPDGSSLIARSRGCGLGVGQAYFDIYIEDPPTSTLVTALRGDPVIFVYDVPLEQAVEITDQTQGAVASLPTFGLPARARYWLDVNNGSDLGGYTYAFRTVALDCQTRNLGSSFFRGQFQDPVFCGCHRYGGGAEVRAADHQRDAAGKPHADGDPYSYGDGHAHEDADPDGHGHPHADPDHHRHAHANAHGDARRGKTHLPAAGGTAVAHSCGVALRPDPNRRHGR